MYRTVFFALLVLGLALVSGCSDDDCTVCPPDQPPAEKEYQFLYTYVDTGYWVYTYSTKDGRTVDSVRYGHYPFWDGRFSKDGKYAYYTTSESGGPDDFATWVTDFTTGDTLSVAYGKGGHWISNSFDGRFIMVSGKKVTIFTLPELSVAYENEQPEWGKGTIHPFRNIA